MTDDLVKRLREDDGLAERLEAANTIEEMQTALVIWDMAYRTGSNEPLVHAFECGFEALSNIKKGVTSDL